MKSGFTLIELLVVVTIIVVLLAMLVPAMDKAIYQAELATCGAKLKGHANAATVYAMEHRRHYLYRPGPRTSGYYRPDYIAYTGDDASYDDRTKLRPYMAINKTMSCPFVKEVDFDSAPSAGNLLYASYAYWYGFTYGDRGMFKIGDRLEWKEGTAGPTSYFSVLASDTDTVNYTNGANNSAHPDKDEFYALATINGPTTFLSYWGRWNTTPARGPLDRNFAYEDHSVLMLNDLLLSGEERVVRIGGYNAAPDSASMQTWLPER